MARIRIIEPHEAQGSLAAIYDVYAAQERKPSTAVKVFSLLPELILPFEHLGAALFHSVRSTHVDERRVRLIGTVVTSLIGCKNCVISNGSRLRELQAGGTDAVRALIRDWRQVDLSEMDRAMLSYCEVLTFDPGRIEAGALDDLRSAGFDDADIVHMTAVVAYFAFWTRIRLPLGANDEIDPLGDELLADPPP